MQNLINSNNSDYHANRTHLSSSMLKLLLKDIAEFDRQWNHGIKSEQSNPAFDEGSYVHSLCLEPEKVAQEYAIFDGLQKKGKRFDAFRAEHAGKIILSAAQKVRAESFYKAYAARAEAVNMLQGGFPEHTMTASILDVPVKARADYININQGYIADIKTTSYPASLEGFKQTVQDYGYDLSAALYCQIAYQIYGKLFDFYFIVISKSDLVCDIYKASSATLSSGNAKVTQALVKYKKCKESGIWLDSSAKPSYDSRDYEILEV